MCLQTVCGVVRQVDKCIRRGRLAIWQTCCGNGSDDTEAFTVLHLNHHVLQDLITQCVAAVKLIHRQTDSENIH